MFFELCLLDAIIRNIRDKDGYLVVYSQTDRRSLERLNESMTLIQEAWTAAPGLTPPAVYAYALFVVVFFFVVCFFSLLFVSFLC